MLSIQLNKIKISIFIFLVYAQSKPIEIYVYILQNEKSVKQRGVIHSLHCVSSPAHVSIRMS